MNRAWGVLATLVNQLAAVQAMTRAALRRAPRGGAHRGAGRRGLRVAIPLALRSPDHISCYVLRLDGEDVRADTGLRGSERALAAGLAGAGVQPDRVLVTHGHIDHWGLATLYADSVLVHPACRTSFAFAADATRAETGRREGLPEVAEMERVFSRYRAMVAGVRRARISRRVTRSATGVCSGRRGTPRGMRACCARPTGSYWRASTCCRFTPNIQRSPERSDALSDFLSSLDRLRELDVSLVLPLHGEPFRDAATRAMELRAHHECRLRQLEDALADGPRPLRPLSEEIFRDLVHGEDRMLAYMETYVHPEYLRPRHRADRRDSGDWARAA